MASPIQNRLFKQQDHQAQGTGANTKCIYRPNIIGAKRSVKELFGKNTEKTRKDFLLVENPQEKTALKHFYPHKMLKSKYCEVSVYLKKAS